MKADTLFLRRAPAPIGAPYRDCLIADDSRSAEALAKLPLGEPVAVKLCRSRSLPQHRLFWSLLDYVAKASKFETAETLLVALKARLGKYDLCQLPNGKVVPVVNSISFSAMDQTEFQDFFDKSIAVICDEVLGGYNPDDLIREVEGKHVSAA